MFCGLNSRLTAGLRAQQGARNDTLDAMGYAFGGMHRDIKQKQITPEKEIIKNVIAVDVTNRDRKLLGKPDEA